MTLFKLPKARAYKPTEAEGICEHLAEDFCLTLASSLDCGSRSGTLPESWGARGEGGGS